MRDRLRVRPWIRGRTVRTDHACDCLDYSLAEHLEVGGGGASVETVAEILVVLGE